MRHKHFLRAASDQARGVERLQATKLAMRFVQVHTFHLFDIKSACRLLQLFIAQQAPCLFNDGTTMLYG